MKKLIILLILLYIIPVFAVQSCYAYWIWTPETGKWVNPKYAVKDSPREQLDYAMAYYDKKDYKKSLVEFEKLVKHYPLSKLAPKAQFYVGLSQESMGNYYKAFEAYKVLLEKYPKYEDISQAVEREYKIGEMFMEGKKRKILGLEILPATDKAIEIFKDVVKNSPYGKYGDVALFKLGECYKRLKRFQEAKEAFQMIIDDYPNSPLITQANFQIALCSQIASLEPSYTQEITEDAIEEFEDFIKKHPDSYAKEEAKTAIDKLREKEAKSLYDIGLFYEKQAKYSAAEIYYNDIINKYPDSPWSAKSLERLSIIKKRTK